MKDFFSGSAPPKLQLKEPCGPGRWGNIRVILGIVEKKIEATIYTIIGYY